MLKSLSTLAIALAVSGAAVAASRQFDQAGNLTIAGAAARPAHLHIACSPDQNGGALSIELTVPEANTRKDFDYDDFEGPDASAGSKALSHLVWTAAGTTTDITLAAAGWYAPEPPDSFMFGVSQPAHRDDAPAKLLAAIGKLPGQLVWTQSGADAKQGALIATFDLDAEAARRVHAAVQSCLPIGKPASKRES